MSKIKSIDDHSATILQLSVELSHLPPYHPDFDKKNDQLSRQLAAWAGKLSITIQVANNEKLPYQSSELGVPCTPMSLKKESMMRQVGDYVGHLNEYDMFAGICIERKTLQDAYSTLMNGEQRSRLYREIARAENDPRFNRFMLIAECTYEEFLKYVPEIFVFTHGTAQITKMKRITEYLKRYYKIKVEYSQFTFFDHGINIMTADSQIQLVYNPTGVSVLIGGVLRETLIKRISDYGKTQYFIRRGATEVSKIETINSLENRIQVSFAGSRERAVEKIPGLIRKWCVQNYEKILNIDANY